MKKTNGSRLDETTVLLQHAMATLLQNQTLFVARVKELKDQMDRKFTEVDRRLERPLQSVSFQSVSSPSWIECRRGRDRPAAVATRAGDEYTLVVLKHAQK